MNDQIEMIDLYGEKVMMPKDRLYFRPAVYGLVVKDRKILLMTARNTGKYCYPGGGVELGETLEQALKRELLEEAGIEISLGKLLDVRESFFYYNPSDDATHGFLFYYLCHAVGDKLKDDKDVIDNEAGKPRWVELISLKPEQFQNWQGEILDKLKI
jgi:mutator protein MutT